MPAYHFQRVEAKWQAYWERAQDVPGRGLRAWEAEALRAGHVSLPERGGAACGASGGVYGDGHFVPVPPDARATTCCTRWGGTPLGCRPSSTRFRRGRIPRVTTQKNVETFKRQIKALGFSYDWDREIDTTDPGYYRWTQWIFLKIHDTWYDPDCEWTDPEGPRAKGQGTADRGAADSGGLRGRGGLSRCAAAGLSGGGAGELVPCARDGAGE